MPFTPDQILDRIKLKKQVFNWRLVAILALTLLLLSMFASNRVKPSKVSVIEPNYIARIHVKGFIANNSDRLEIIKDIEENSSIKAVIMHIDSGGGTSVGGETLYNAVRKVSEKKPVVAVMEGVAASGAYMTAIASDHLIAHQTSIVGSIGVIMQSMEFTELAKTIGVKFHNFKSSPLKGGPLPTEPLSSEMKKAVQDAVDDTYDVFVSMVAERRKIPTEKLLKIADGRVYTGRQALKNGLIDEIGDEETAHKWLKEEKKIDKSLNIKTIDLEKPTNKLGKLFETVSNFNVVLEKITNSGFLAFF